MSVAPLLSAPQPSLTPTRGMETTTLRGLRAIRLSVLTDETTSVDRQRETNDRAAAALGIDFDGREACDLDVSASKTSPFERPDLGEWLRKPAEYDAIVFWRFDRAIRSMADMSKLAEWAREHGIVIVFAEGLGGSGPMTFDFRDSVDPVAELMLTLFAFAAQVESQSTSDRVTGARAAMRTMPLRWRGGRAPFAYRSVPMPAEHGGAGMTPVPDSYGVELLERIIRELLAGASLQSIADGLNADNKPTWRDYTSQKKGSAIGGKSGGRNGRVVERFRWTANTLKGILTSPTLLGWEMHAGTPVRDVAGAPVLFTTDPILTREEFDRIGAAVTERCHKWNGAMRRDSADAFLLRLIHCDACGGRVYRHQGDDARPYAIYYCNPRARGERCDRPAIVRAEWVDAYVTREFLRIVGPIEYRRTITTPGYDPKEWSERANKVVDEGSAAHERFKELIRAEPWFMVVAEYRNNAPTRWLPAGGSGHFHVAELPFTAREFTERGGSRRSEHGRGSRGVLQTVRSVDSSADQDAGTTVR